MIDSIITNYLNANKRLVIPGFGAFIRKDLGNVVLVEFLKKDDGVLTSLVGEKYSVSEEQARGIVDQFIERVKAEVDGTGKSVVDGLGVVYKETSGVYEIEYRPGIVRAKQAKVADVPRPAIVPASPAIQASAKPGESAVHHQHRSQSNPAHHQSDTVDIAAGKSERRAVTTPAMTDAGTKTGAITGAISGATTPQHDAAQAKPRSHNTLVTCH